MKLTKKIKSALAGLFLLVDSANAFDLESKIEKLLQVKDQEKGEEIIQEIADMNPKEEAFLFDHTENQWYRITKESKEGSVSHQIPSLPHGTTITDYHTHPRIGRYEKCFELSGITPDGGTEKQKEWCKWQALCRLPSHGDIAYNALFKPDLKISGIELKESRVISACVWAYSYQGSLDKIYEKATEKENKKLKQRLEDLGIEVIESPLPCPLCTNPTTYYIRVESELEKQTMEIYMSVAKKVNRQFFKEGKENLSKLFEEAYHQYPELQVRLTTDNFRAKP